MTQMVRRTVAWARRRGHAVVNHHAHRGTDVYLVGYPKTGNTWVKFLVSEYVELLANPDCPPIQERSDPRLFMDSPRRFARPRRVGTGPTISSTHEPLNWKTQRARDLTFGNVIRPFTGKRIVLIVRHPLDTLTSFWFYQRFGTREEPDLDFDPMLEDDVKGLGKFLSFYNLWATFQDHTLGTWLLRYEDLQRDTQKTFSAALDFIGLPHREDLVAEAVHRSSFEQMRRLEAAGVGLRTRSGKTVFTGKGGDTRGYKVRQGKVGQYREYLAQEQSERYERLIRERLAPWYGYE